MLSGLILQAIGLTFELLHLWYYSTDGEGITPLDVFSRVFNGVSEVVLSLLFIILASGWTIRFENIFDEGYGMDILLAFAPLICGVQIAIAALDFLDLDAAHKYHDFAGIQGWFLIATKLLILGVFIYKVVETQKEVE